MIGTSDDDVSARDPRLMSLVEDRAGETSGADALVTALAEDLAPDDDDDGDDDGD